MLVGSLPFVPQPVNNIAQLHSLILKGCEIPDTLSEGEVLFSLKKSYLTCVCFEVCFYVFVTLTSYYFAFSTFIVSTCNIVDIFVYAF